MATQSELIAAMGTRSLTESEVAELRGYIEAADREQMQLRAAAKVAGIAMPNADKVQRGAKLLRDVYFLTQWEQMYTRYKMLDAVQRYNTFAVEHGLQWCDDVNDLPKLIATLPAVYHANAVPLIADTKTTYTRSWGKQVNMITSLLLGIKRGTK